VPFPGLKVRSLPDEGERLNTNRPLGVWGGRCAVNRRESTWVSSNKKRGAVRPRLLPRYDQRYLFRLRVDDHRAAGHEPIGILAEA
jgi:hypothetical protein